MKIASIFVLSLLALTGCSKTPETADAVKQGIIKDLAKKMDINNMDVQVTSIAFHGETADAVVSFSPKGQPSAGMSLPYSMVKKEDGWHIAARKGNAAAHGGVAPGTSTPAGTMPSGHPPIETPKQ